MTKALFALLALAFITAPASAGDYLNAQFGNAIGFTQGSGKPQCGTVTGQCVPVASGVHGLAGTFTVKRNGVEVLLQLKCGIGVGQIVWAGERFVGTSDISLSGLSEISGPCWFLWQEANSSGLVVAGGDFEYQVVIW